MSKITVKHFIDKKTGKDINNFIKKPNEVEFEQIDFPLYIKISYQGKTTQVRSIIDTNFKDIEEAYAKQGNRIEAEKVMYEENLKREIDELGSHFHLKGIKDRLKKHHVELRYLMIHSRLLDKIYSFFNDRGSNFCLFFEDHDNRLPIEDLTEAAYKLSDKDPAFKELMQKHNYIIELEKHFNGFENKEWGYAFEWFYGNMKTEWMLALKSQPNAKTIMRSVEKQLIDLGELM